MPTAKDGSKHASHSRAKMHDEREEEKKKTKAPAGEHEPKGDAGEEKAPKPGNHAEPDGDEEENPATMEDSPESIDDVMAQHGPAEKVHAVTSEGVHHMVTHHGGVKHKTSHTDPMAAGQHMAHAMGHQAPVNAPEPAGAGMGGDATGMGGGGGIPGMM